MRLVDLPHELIQECAARLEPHDLATLVATSSYLHGVLLPTLYRSVTIRYALYTGRGQAEAEQLQMLSLRQTLRSIAASQERCRLIRKLELRNYGRWFGEEEAGWVETIVKHTRSLERVDLLQDDDGEPFDEALTPLANFKPVWIAFKTLPSLRVLHCSYGPNVRLGLEEFPSLVETSLSMYYVDSPLDGTLPPSLRSLSLDYVNGISHEWLRPSTFSHLESLALADLTVAQLQVISGAVKTFVASVPTRVSTLRRVNLDLFRRAAGLQLSPIPASAFYELLVSFSMLLSIEILSLHSTPLMSRTRIAQRRSRTTLPSTSSLHLRPLFDTIRNYPLLVELGVRVSVEGGADCEVSWITQDQESTLEQLDVLSSLKHLRVFATLLYHGDPSWLGHDAAYRLLAHPTIEPADLARSGESLLSRLDSLRAVRLAKTLREPGSLWRRTG